MNLIDKVNLYYAKYPLIKEIRVNTPCPEDLPITKLTPASVGHIIGGHAHLMETEYKNLICICNKVFLRDDLVAHEYAHIIAGGDHGKEWQEAISYLGFPNLVYNQYWDITVDYSEIEFD